MSTPDSLGDRILAARGVTQDYVDEQIAALRAYLAALITVNNLTKPPP